MLSQEHFPDQAAKLSGTSIVRLLAPLRDNRYNTLSSALTLLALEARGGNAAAAMPSLQALDAAGKARAIGKPSGILTSGTFAAGDSAIRSNTSVAPESSAATFSRATMGASIP